MEHKKTEHEKTGKTAKAKSSKLNLVFFGVAMFLLGVVGFLGFRIATYKSDDVHYHANFALYVDGARDEFKSFGFYEEVAACDVHDKDDVRGRAHMHNQNSSLIHVHANAVSWGHFFANLGYTLGDDALTTDKGSFVNGQDGKTLTFYLNGEKVANIQNKLIKTEDVLLINYDQEDKSILQERFNKIPKDAAKANTTPDPAACSGSEDATLLNRFKSALGLDTH